MAPIVIDRKTGEIVSCPTIPQDLINLAWEMLLTAYIRKYPDVFLEVANGEGK